MHDSGAYKTVGVKTAPRLKGRTIGLQILLIAGASEGGRAVDLATPRTRWCTIGLLTVGSIRATGAVWFASMEGDFVGANSLSGAGDQ